METLPPSLAVALRPVLPALAEETIAAIGHEVPDYRRPLEGPFGEGLRMGVENALARFVDAVEDPAGADASAMRETYVGLGMLEFHAGRSLDALLSAYRLGARLAWERFLAAGRDAGHDPEVLFRLAGALFTYIDRISAESVEGYARERSATEAERGRRRRALVRLLAAPDATPEEVRVAAEQAAWARPATVAGMVAADAVRLGADALAVEEDGLALVFVPDPEGPGRRAQLRAALGDVRAALGPAVPVERAAVSLARARAAFALQDEGLLPGDGLVVADEHLPALLLHGDAELATDLARRALAPLDPLRPLARERLLTTLAAWIDTPGQVKDIAGRLHVHPQTVRYRVAQLRELFGERLDDADGRFELALAVRLAR